MQITLTLNQQTLSIETEPDTPLLWVIRDQIGLKGTKFGCGMGLCGACTVHLDGQPIRACLTPVLAAAGRHLTTIEGLGTPEQPHVLQRHWQALNVPQCGYCQSGQLMTAAALLANNPSPNPGEVREAMSGNLCRCGTYPRIEAAILAAAAEAQGDDA